MFKTAPPPNKKVSKQVSHFFLYSDMYILQYIVKLTKEKLEKVNIRPIGSISHFKHNSVHNNVQNT